MVEWTFEEHKLPGDFADKVLREVSVLGVSVQTAEVEREDAEKPKETFKVAALLLADKAEGKRVLPIWTGLPEATAIGSKLEGRSPPRPMTHDLMANILSEFRMKLVRVVITELRDHTFLARLVIEREGVTKEIDARPSDAVALALRMNASIFVVEELLETSGINLEEAREMMEEGRESRDTDRSP